MSEKPERKDFEGIILMRFFQEGERVKTITGTNIPVPREGNSVRLGNREIDYTTEDNEEEEEVEGNFVVGNVDYGYDNVRMVYEDEIVDTALIVVDIDVLEDEEP
jgi:hypothetical protein